MLGVPYQTKKDLKASVGQPLKHIETSLFGLEYKPNGVLTVVGPDPYHKRSYFAQVIMENGLIKQVK